MRQPRDDLEVGPDPELLAPAQHPLGLGELHPLIDDLEHLGARGLQAEGQLPAAGVGEQRQALVGQAVEPRAVRPVQLHPVQDHPAGELLDEAVDQVEVVVEQVEVRGLVLLGEASHVGDDVVHRGVHEFRPLQALGAERARVRAVVVEHVRHHQLAGHLW